MRVIDRAAWGARTTVVDRGQQPTTPISRRSEFFVHWLGERPANLRGAELVRWVQAFHIDSRGWADIGYNYAVDVDGTVYVGRGRDVVGAHCLNHNTSGIGVVVLIGKGERATEAALASVRQLWADASQAAGHELRQLGHRDGFSTDCPGDELWAWTHAGMPVDGAAVAPRPAPHRPPAAAVPPYPGRLLRRGSFSGAVKQIQARLIARGWNLGPAGADGLYGPRTEAVVRAFQAEKGLGVDGIVGPHTWAAAWSAPIT